MPRAASSGPPIGTPAARTPGWADINSRPFRTRSAIIACGPRGASEAHSRRSSTCPSAVPITAAHLVPPTSRPSRSCADGEAISILKVVSVCRNIPFQSLAILPAIPERDWERLTVHAIKSTMQGPKNVMNVSSASGAELNCDAEKVPRDSFRLQKVKSSFWTHHRGSTRHYATKRDTFRLLLVLSPPPEIGGFRGQTRSLWFMRGLPAPRPPSRLSALNSPL